MQPIDILIIGGGPAGLSTVLHLVQSTPELTSRILVLEKAHYPRPKLCGGALVADAEIILEHLGLDVNEIPSVKAKFLHLNFKRKGIQYTHRKGHALRIIKRDEFDAWLANKARKKGILIQEGIQVVDLQVEDDHVIVHTNHGDILAQVVVGADGSNGPTRQSIFPKSTTNKARLLEVLTPNSDQKSDSNAFFDFLPTSQGIAGYIWNFPTQIYGLSIRSWGIYDANLYPDERRPSLKDTLYIEMINHGWNPETLELKSHPIRWFSPLDPMSVERILLVGDAAGVDPLFGEGISIALGYGKVAAGAIIEAFKHQKFDFKNYKHHLKVSSLGRALTARWVIAQIIYSLHWDWFQFLLWRVIKPITMSVANLFVLNWGKRLK